MPITTGGIDYDFGIEDLDSLFSDFNANPDLVSLWDKRRRQMEEREGFEDAPISSWLGGMHTGIMATPESINLQSQQIDELWDAWFGDEEAQKQSRLDRQEAQAEYDAVTKAEYESMANPDSAASGGWVGGILAEELPFLIGSMGVGTAVKAGAKGLFKAAGKNLAKETAGKIGSRTALGATAGVHGLRSGGGMFSEAVEMTAQRKLPSLMEANPDLTNEQVVDLAYAESQDEARGPATAAGALTAGLVTLFGFTGPQSWFLRGNKEGGDAVAKTIGGYLGSMVKHGAFEGTEEGIDALGQGLIAKGTYDPERTWGQIGTHVLDGIIAGGIMGSAYRGAFTAPTPIANSLERAYDRVFRNKSKIISEYIDLVSEANPELSKEEATKRATDSVDAILAELEEGGAVVTKSEDVAEEGSGLPLLPEEDVKPSDIPGYPETADPEGELVHESKPKADGTGKSAKTWKTGDGVWRNIVRNEDGSVFRDETIRVVYTKDDDGDIWKHVYRFKDGKVVSHHVGVQPRADKKQPRAWKAPAGSHSAPVAGTESGFNRSRDEDGNLVEATSPEEDAMNYSNNEAEIITEEEALAAATPEGLWPRYEKGSRNNIEQAGDDLGKRASVAHGVRKSEKFAESTQEFQDYVNGVIQEAEDAGYTTEDATGKKYTEGTLAEPNFTPATEADESLRLEDGIHRVIKKVNRPALFKDGKLVGGSLLPQYEVVVFGPKGEVEADPESEAERLEQEKLRAEGNDSLADLPPKERAELLEKTRKELGLPTDEEFQETVNKKFKEELERKAADGDQTAIDLLEALASVDTPASAPATPAAAPTETTDHVLSVSRRKGTKGKEKVAVDEIEGRPATPEADLGFTLGTTVKHPAVLKWNAKRKAWGVGYYAGKDAKGKPKFNESFSLKDDSLVRTSKEGGKVIGAIIPRAITASDFISKSLSEKDGTWVATDARTSKKINLITMDETPQDEVVQAIVDNIKVSGLKNILAEAQAHGVVTLESIRSLINEAEKGKSKQDKNLERVYSGSIEDAPKLAKALVDAISFFSEPKYYRDLIRREYKGKISRDEETEIKKQAASLKGRGNKVTRAVAVSRLLTNASEVSDRMRRDRNTDDDMLNYTPVDVDSDTADLRPRENWADELSNLEDEQEGTVDSGESIQTDTRPKSQLVDDIANGIEKSRRGSQMLASIDFDNPTAKDIETAQELASAVAPDNPALVLEVLADVQRKLFSAAGRLGATKLKAGEAFPDAKGPVQISKIVNDPFNGMTDKQRGRAQALLRRLTPMVLDNLTLRARTGVTDSIIGGEGVYFEGSFNSLLNLAEVVTGEDTSPDVVAEEIAHFTAKVLPTKHRREAIRLQRAALGRRIKEVEAELDNEETADRLKILKALLGTLDEIKKRGGEVNSQEYAAIANYFAVKEGVEADETGRTPQERVQDMFVQDRTLYYDSITASVGTEAMDADYNKALLGDNGNDSLEELVRGMSEILELGKLHEEHREAKIALRGVRRGRPERETDKIITASYAIWRAIKRWEERNPYSTAKIRNMIEDAAELGGYTTKGWHGSTHFLEDNKYKSEYLGHATGAASAKEGFFFSKDRFTAESYGNVILSKESFEGLRVDDRLLVGQILKLNEAMKKERGTFLFKGETVYDAADPMAEGTVDLDHPDARTSLEKNLGDREEFQGESGVSQNEKSYGYNHPGLFPGQKAKNDKRAEETGGVGPYNYIEDIYKLEGSPDTLGLAPHGHPKRWVGTGRNIKKRILEAQDHILEYLASDVLDYGTDAFNGEGFNELMFYISDGSLTELWDKGTQNTLTPKGVESIQNTERNIDRWVESDTDTNGLSKEFKRVAAQVLRSLRSNKAAMLRRDDPDLDPEFSSTIDRYTSQLHEVYLRMVDPGTHDDKKMGYREETYLDRINSDKSAGRDSTIIKNTQDGGTKWTGKYIQGASEFTDVYVVYEPEQVKSSEIITFSLDPITKIPVFAPPSKRFNVMNANVAHSFRYRKGRAIGSPKLEGSEEWLTKSEVQKLKRLLKKSVASGEGGRYWYERSSDMILKLTGGNVTEAERIVQLIAVFSPQNKVQPNLDAALKAYMRWRSGMTRAAFVHPDHNMKMGRDMENAAALLYDGKEWAGRKTNNFYNNLMILIDPTRTQGATVDMWIARMFGYKTDGPSDAQYTFMEEMMTQIANNIGWTIPQVQAGMWVYAQGLWVSMKGEIDDAAKEAGIKKDKETGKYNLSIPEYDRLYRKMFHERVKKDLRMNMDSAGKYIVTEEDLLDFSNATARRVINFSNEFIPGNSSGILSGMIHAPDAIKVEYTANMLQAFYDQKTKRSIIGEELGWSNITGMDEVYTGSSTYINEAGETESNPSTVVQGYGGSAKGGEGSGKLERDADLSPLSESMYTEELILQSLYARQEMGAGYRAMTGGTASQNKGAIIDAGKPLNAQETRSLVRAAADLVEDAGGQAWAVSFYPNPNGITMVNLSAEASMIPNEEFKAFVKKATTKATQVQHVGRPILKKKDLPKPPKFNIKVFTADTVFVENNWKEDTNGEGYIRRSITARTSDILARLDERIGVRIDAVYRKWERRGYGNAPTKPTKFSTGITDISARDDWDRILRAGAESNLGGRDASRSEATVRVNQRGGFNLVDATLGDGTATPRESIRSASDGDGRGTAGFFSNVTNGTDTSHVPKRTEYRLLIPLEEGALSFKQERDKHRGNFDNHIASSIPGFDDLQSAVGWAITQTYGQDGADMLDVGASEGALNKAITTMSRGRVKTVALDPNPSMALNYDSISKVDGAEYALAAWSSKEDEGSELWVDEEANAPILGYKPDRQFDVVHEAMTFQFIDNKRPAHIARMKEHLKEDGIVILEEKVGDRAAQYRLNEDLKDDYKRYYFSEAQIQTKAKEVLAGKEDEIEGMQGKQVSKDELELALNENFQNVVMIWDSGNFKGYVASDDAGQLQRFLSNLQPTDTQFSNTVTPNVVASPDVDLIQFASARAETAPDFTPEGWRSSDSSAGFLSQEHSPGMQEIIDRSYDVSNPDEFYAKGLVSRANEGLFRRGLNIALNILDGIREAHGNVEAGERREKRKFFEEVEDMLKTGEGLDLNRSASFGGLLIREGIEAGSLNIIKSPKRLAAARDLLLDQGRAGRAEKIGQQARAGTSLIRDIIKRYLPKDVSKTAYNILGLHRADEMWEVVKNIPGPKEYTNLRAKFLADDHSDLAAALADTSYKFLKMVEGKMEGIIASYRKQAAKMSGEKFQKLAGKVQLELAKKNLTQAAAADISKQLNAAVNAISSVSPSARTTNVLLEIAGSEEQLKALQSKNETILGRVGQIASILSQSPQGQRLLIPNSKATAADVKQLAREMWNIFRYQKTLMSRPPNIAGLTPLPSKPVFDPVGVNLKIWEMAAGMLAVNHSLKENALAVVFASDPDMELASVKDFATKLGNDMQHKDPLKRAAALQRALKKVTRFTEKAERQRLIFQKYYETITKEFKNLRDLYQAAQVARQYLLDPDLKGLKLKLVNDSKAVEAPAFADESWYDKFENGVINVPVPSIREEGKGTVVKVRIVSDEGGTKELNTLVSVIDTLQSWLQNNFDAEKNEPTSPYFGYYWNWYHQLTNTYASELVMNPKQNERLFFNRTFFAIPERWIDNFPTRSAEIAKRRMQKFITYFNLMGDWSAKHADPWKVSITKAAKSHDISHDTVQEMLNEWNLKVGNALKYSHQEGGVEFDVGSELPSGEVVTKEDMDLLEYESRITAEAFNVNEEISGIDESILPSTIKEQVGKKKYQRMPLAKGKNFLPRVFSTEGRQLVRDYKELTRKREEATVELFDDLVGVRRDALISFINDRNPEFIAQAPSSLETVYNDVAAEVRENKTSPEVEAIVERIAELGSKSKDEVKVQIMEELAPMLNRLAEFVTSEDDTDPALTISSYRKDSPFSKARKDALAPYYFYQHGFKSTLDMRRFAMLGFSQPFEQLVSAVKSMSTELDTIKTGLLSQERTIMREAKFRGMELDSIEVQRELGKRIKLAVKDGRSFIPVRDQIDILKQEADIYVDRFVNAFDPSSVGQREDMLPAWWQRSWGIAVGGTLQSFGVLLKNKLDSTIYGGLQLGYLTGQTGATAFMSSMLYHMPVVAGKMMGSAAKSVGPALGKTFTKGFHNALRGTKNARGLDKLIAPIRGFLSPAAEEYSMNMPLRIKEYQMLSDRGLGMPVTPEATMESLEGDLVSGGRGVGAYRNDNAMIQYGVRGMMSLVGEGEAVLALTGRPFFPRIGDIAGNTIISRLAYQFVNRLDYMLRRVYMRRQDRGTDMSKDISPEELLGRYLGVFKANRASYNELLNTLGRAGVTNFQAEAQNFLAKIAAGETDAQFLTNKQRDQVASIFVTMSNAATPTNRSLVAKTSAAWNVALSLMGWGLNMFQVFGEKTFLFSRSRQGAAHEKAMQSFASLVFLVAAMAATVPEAELVGWLVRLWKKHVLGKEDTRTLMQDVVGLDKKAKVALSLSPSTIPLMGAGIEAYLNNTPGRGLHHPGSLAIGKVSDLAAYGIGVAATGDWTYRGAETLHSITPMTQAFTRFTEQQKGKNISLAASRLIRKYYGDQDQIDPPYFKNKLEKALGLSELNPLKDRFSSEVARGDAREAVATFAEMVRTAKEIGKEDPIGSVKASLRGRNPVNYTLRSKPTKSEFFRQLKDMPSPERTRLVEILSRYQKVWSALDLGPLFKEDKKGLDLSLPRMPKGRMTPSRFLGGGRARPFKPTPRMP